MSSNQDVYIVFPKPHAGDIKRMSRSMASDPFFDEFPRATCKQWLEQDHPALKRGERGCILRTTATIEHEWSVRLPNETQAEFASLFDANPQGSPYRATLTEVRAVRDDCAFMLDKDGPNLTGGERRAYKALLRQCQRVLEATK